MTATSGSVVASVGDPEGTRTITAIVALLVVLGIGLVMLAVWLFKLTRPDAELLAPLEVMGERKWRRADPVWQRRRLDEVRPDGAQPLQPSAAPPDLDEAFDAGPAGSGFDDLHDDPAEPAAADESVEPELEETDAAPDDSTDVATDDEPVPATPPAATAPPSSNGDRAAPRHATAPTPIGLPRPGIDEFPDHELDPDVMAAAMAELDAELGLDRKPDQP